MLLRDNRFIEEILYNQIDKFLDVRVTHGHSIDLSVDEYDQMVLRSAFAGLQKRIELFRGELIEMNPAGPVHDDYISYLTRWSIESTQGKKILVRSKSGLSLPELESRPECLFAMKEHWDKSKAKL